MRIIITRLMSILMIAGIFSACKKTEDVDPIGSAGHTLVKVLEGGTPGSKLFAIDFVTTPTTLTVADFRREVPAETELVKTMTITVKDDIDAVVAAGLVHLDPAWYTLADGVVKTGGQGGIYTLTFGPGEFAKPISITIPDATVLDPSLTYGLGFTILTADQNGVITANKTLIVEIGAKNIYDGVYLVSGNFTHPTVDYVGPFGTPTTGGPMEVALVTTGANTNSRLGVAPADIAGYDGFVFWVTSAQALSGFSNVFPEYSVDPATNIVTVYSNNPASTVVWQNYNSTYDPATRSFTMDYGYNTTTRRMQETWTYLRPR